VTRIVIAVLLLLSCVDGPEESMPQTLTTKVRGLWTSPNEHGEVPPGALVRADDVVLTRDGIAEQRRGQPQRIASPAAALMPYGGRLVVQSGSTLSISDEEVTALTPFVGTFDPVTGRRMRGAEANGNLYVATASGVKRLDAVDGAFVDAGVPSGLDVDAATTGAAGFMPTDSAVGYRVVWGERDANGNLLLGPPSGRGVVSNTSGGNRDVNVSTSIPPGIDPERHFWQLYRTPPSVGASIDPGEEFGLVYEGPVPVSANVTSLVRASNVVTATTAEPHGFAVGQVVRVGPGGALPGHAVALGTGGAAARSTDNGTSWSGGGISGLSGSYFAVVGNGVAYVAVGSNVCASSVDGLTWTPRTIPAGTYRAIVWTGSKFVAVGDAGAGATSADGITWSAVTVVSASHSWTGLAWNGSTLLALGRNTTFQHGTSLSPDGTSWGSFNASADLIGKTVTWTGSRWTTGFRHSTNGISWITTTGPSSGVSGVAVGGGVVVATDLNKVYRSTNDAQTWTLVGQVSTNAFRGALWAGSVFLLVAADEAYSSADGGLTWTSGGIPAGSYYALAASGGAVFSAGEKVITSVPGADEFTYAEVSANGSLTQPQTAAPLTASIVDTIPATFTGATLYTSPSQEGALAAQYEPPIARDVAEFRGSLLWLGTTAKAALEVWMLAVDSSGASSGIRAGDTITINGMVFTAGASESASTRTFQRYTAGTPSQNVASTAASLVRVVNRGQGSPVTCRDMASANETPGRLRLEARNRTDSIDVTVSRPGSWAFTNGQEAAPEDHANELRWSPKGKPDANPLTAYQRIDGKGDGVRVLALRDSALAIMARGIYRVTGDGLSATNPPSITPLDTTTEIVAPDTVVALDNLGFGLSSKGVVQISDQGGVTLLSRPIEDQIRPLLVEPMLSTVRTVAFGVANEAEGKFYLWVPETAGATQATKAFVYDHHASLAAGEPVWTVRTDDAACGIVHTDGRLYTGTATAIHRERKSLDVTDYADAETAVSIPAPVTSNTIPLASVSGIVAGDVIAQGDEWAIVLSVGADSVFLDRVVEVTAGAATVYKAILTVVEWAPLIPAPGGSAQFSEATFLFRKLGGAAFTAEFATEIVPAYAAVSFDGVAMGLNTDPAAVNLRTWVPRDQQRASRLQVRFSHAQAWSPVQLEGLSVIWTPTSIRVRR
jgi:hypothetical protein